MLSSFAKFFLVLTSLSPLYLVIGFVNFSSDPPRFCYGIIWFVFALLMLLFCLLMLRYMSKSAQIHPCQVKEFERSDAELLMFIMTYLLPLLSTNQIWLAESWLTGLLIIATIAILLFYANALHFNPIMALVGYHFYRVKDNSGVSCLLISRSEIRRPREVRIVRLAYDIYLDIGDKRV